MSNGEYVNEDGTLYMCEWIAAWTSWLIVSIGDSEINSRMIEGRLGLTEIICQSGEMGH